MKRIFSILVTLLLVVAANAQVPYYAGSQGKGNTYTYFSTKFHPTKNNQQMYITVQHGLTDWLDIATDATVGTGWSYQGFGVRFNAVNKEYFALGGQVMQNFDLNDGYKPAYTSAGLYMNGKIVSGLHWASNTWYTTYYDTDQIDQWTYLGYTIGKFTPMVGAITDCTNNFKTDLAVGVYANLYKGGYVYLWGSGLTNRVYNPRVVIGFDYKF